MKWTDVQSIAMDLEDNYPNQEIKTIAFTKLHELICSLPDFNDDPKGSNERILEAIFLAWLDERD